MKEVNRIMAGVQELNAKIQEVLDAVNSERTQVADAINNFNLAIEDLKRQLEEMQVAADLQLQIDALENVRNQIAGIYNQA